LRAPGRSAARRAAGVLLPLLLAAGLWQCTDDGVGSHPGSVEVVLKRGAGLPESAVRIDSLEIEVFLRGAAVAAETARLDGAGAFSATFSLPAGEDYRVRVLAFGAAGDAWPDGSRQEGIVAAGEAGRVGVPAGRLARVDVPLERVESRLLGAGGAPGSDSLRLRWSSVAGASGYRFGWYAARAGALEISPPQADTFAVLAWGGGGAAGRGVVPSDSVLFRALPEFSGRGGVFGPGLWRDLSLWLDLPRLIALAPAQGDTVEVEGLAVELSFDRGMETASLAAGVTWERIHGGPVGFTVTARDPEPSSRFLLLPDAELSMGAAYGVTVTPGVLDADGRPFDADPALEGLQALTVGWRTAPYAPLRVLEVSPAPGALGRDRSAAVRVRFNRAVDPTSVGQASLYLTDSWGARPAPAAIEAAGDSAVWLPAQPHWYATTCTLHLTTAIRAADGKPFDQDPQTYPEREGFRSFYTTLEQPPGPRVVSVAPDSGATGVALGSPIRVEFSVPVDPATVSPTTTFRLLRGGSVGIPGTVTGDPTGRVFTFRPAAELERGTAYLVRVLGEGPGGGVRDLQGQPLDQDRSLPGYQPFESWFTAAPPPAVVALAFEPARADTFVDSGAAVRLWFSRPLEPASVTSGSVRLELAGEGVEAEAALAPDGSVRLVPAGPLEWLTRYTLVADTLLAALDGSRFDQDPLAPGHHPYRRGFTTEPESLHPAVAAVTPADSADGVALTSVVTIAFTRAVAPATVTAESFVLERVGPGGEVTPVPGTVAASGAAATLTPAAPLSWFSDYRVRVTSAVTDPSGLLRLDQDPLTPGLQPFLSVLRTTRETVPPRVESVFPGNGAGNVSISTEVALLFSEPMDAARLPGAFHLRRDESETPGGGVLDGTGRIYTFTPDEPLAYLTTYIVEVDTTACDLAGNSLDGDPGQPGRESFVSSFTTERDRVPPRVTLREPANGSQDVGPDVVVRYEFSEPLAGQSVTAQAFRLSLGAAGVPGSARLAEDGRSINWTPVALPDSSATILEFGRTYTVTADTLLTDLAGNRLDQFPGVPGRQADVSFFTTRPETLAPRVIALLPAAVDVPVGAHPALVFSEPMDEASLLLPAAVALTLAGQPVAHSRLLCAAGDTLRLVPDDRLAYYEVYAVAVDTLARDLAGNGLDQQPDLPGRQPYAGSFRTEPDRDPPFVLAVSPADGAPHVDPRARVELTFSEPLAPSTVNAANLYIVGEEGVVPLREGPALDDTGSLVTLVPAALAQGGGYDVIVTHLVTDLAGNRMAHTPGQPAFRSAFAVGWLPVVVWSGGLCAPSDTTRVLFDASGSYDPAPGDSIVAAVWGGGDGARDTLAAPAGLVAAHTYGCLDLAGCDGLDNDGDGEIDESGPEGCDESYRVILELIDTHGLAGADTAGVSFCPLLVRACDLAPGERLALHASIRLGLTKAVDPATLDSAVVLTGAGDSTAAPRLLTLEQEGRTLVIEPRGLHGGAYRLEVSPLLATPEGLALDQDLCLPGRQAFVLDFLGPVKPDGAEPAEDGGYR